MRKKRREESGGEYMYGLLRLEAMIYQHILVDITPFKHQSNR